ncbi:hypothetical protein ACIQ7Q_01815 [Streptomyces sp. NPDC096176]|uniref:hypothetical protein n=1 Tax=Streptomyces sp. NPDC096176 TaxID=3366079 RepID=UPI0038184DFB
MDERKEPAHHLDELLSVVHRVAAPGTGGLDCGTPGHQAGHICLAPSEAIGLPALQEALGGRYGRPRNLAMGGFADPTVSARTGLPLLAPFGERIVEMRGWAFADRWIGCGSARAGDDVRLVVLVAERETPEAETAERTAWLVGRRDRGARRAEPPADRGARKRDPRPVGSAADHPDGH